VTLSINRLAPHRRSSLPGWMLAWFITVRWIFAIVMVLRQVR